ncbi:YraN family protein [Oceanicola sp. S124]|uniref:YraN family protein n=1 Tax=Oceanicola sp. S124 TaxID=1042378 RepID=UPI00025585A4|nr:YraN family protein [Oceanicola sp. S124]
MAEVLEFRNPRVDRGRCAYLSGLAAEDSVLRHYEGLGATLERGRYRGAGAEIDLILREGDTLVFVEVKAAPTFDQAAQRVRWSQLHRIMRAAEAYGARCGGFPPQMRIDVALVDGRGMVQILENVSMAA